MDERWSVDDNGCWIWRGATIKGGYGRMWDSASKRKVLAHRAMYEAHVGPIPDGLHIDHLCRNPACVNPGHLEAVTPAENARRTRGHHRRLDWARIVALYLDGMTAEQVAVEVGTSGVVVRKILAKTGTPRRSRSRWLETYCKNGHRRTDENTLWRKGGSRECRACHNQRERERRERMRSDR